jgi:hypothetical protein
MPIGTIESKKQVDYKLVYGRADGMPNSLESMVVCDSCSRLRVYIQLNTTYNKLAKLATVSCLEVMASRQHVESRRAVILQHS